MTEETEDQKRLRSIVEEIERILKAHDVGGVCLVASHESAAWAHNLPSWSAVKETSFGHVVNLAINDQDNDPIRSARTVHLLACFRDLAHDCVSIYGRLHRVAVQQLQAAGLIPKDEHTSARVVTPIDRTYKVN